ncbi:MAG: hypothetical protein ABJN40_22585 [Sneathiella sp.]
MRLLTDSITDPDLEQERRKSDVRINVTYGVVFLYVLMASVFTGLLIAIGEVEKALVIFGSVATMAAGITGFWFGSRGTGYAASPSSDTVQTPENQTPSETSPHSPTSPKSNENSE